jgi:hypothetical protein
LSAERLREYLLKRKEGILAQWFERTVASYPPETGRFLRSQREQFTNPVGHAIRQALEALLEGVLRAQPPTDEAKGFLENLIKVRAVQDFSPSQAVAFILALKDILLRELSSEQELLGHYPELQGRVDALVLLAFDMYAAARERVYECRVEEVQRLNHRLWQRAGLLGPR